MVVAIKRDVHAVHYITHPTDLSFDEAEYSKFKHGSKDAARKFGEKLANSFVRSVHFKNYLENFGDTQIVVLSSPYNFIPTATFAMKDYFMAVLNTHLFLKGKKPAQECKIFRSSSYIEDYSVMSIDKRREMLNLSGDEFHIDAAFLEGKFCMFMDDIRITGNHERCIEEMLEKFGMNGSVAHLLYLYYAVLKNDEIPASIEGRLNHAFVNDLKDLGQIILHEGFLFNTRNVKFILKQPIEDFKWFLSFQKKTFIETFYHLAIGNGYNSVEAFETNFLYLNSLIEI